ncbi:hypothetical protein FPQ18DRAFT_345726, partial [Pyronema domesticum]
MDSERPNNKESSILGISRFAFLFCFPFSLRTTHTKQLFPHSDSDSEPANNLGFVKQLDKAFGNNTYNSIGKTSHGRTLSELAARSPFSSSSQLLLPAFLTSALPLVFRKTQKTRLLFKTPDLLFQLHPFTTKTRRLAPKPTCVGLHLCYQYSEYKSQPICARHV